MRGALRAEWIEIRFEMPALAPCLNEARDGGLFYGIGIDQRSGGLIRLPTNRALDDTKIAENFFVESVFTFKQRLQTSEKSAGFRALDHAVIVGARHRHHFADSEIETR